MMGSEKLDTIRKRVRASFQMTDAQLLAWFNRQMDQCQRMPQEAESAMETLRLLRDALLKEAKSQKPRRKRPGASAARR